MEESASKINDKFNLKEKISELNLTAWNLRYKNSKKAVEISGQAYLLALETGETDIIMQSRLIKTICSFLNRSEIEKNENELIVLKKYFEEMHDSKNSIIAADYLARIYDSYGWYEKAIELAQKALKKIQFLNQPEIKSELLTTQANIYRRLKDYDNALAHNLRALEIREKSDDKLALASTLNLLGRTYSENNDLEKSYQYYGKALSLRNEINDPAISFTYIGLASNYELENKLTDAEKMYLKCLESNSHFSNDKICNYLGYSGLGNVYMKTRNHEKAVRMFDMSLKYAVESNIPINICKTHHLLSQVYEKLNELDKALDHLKKFSALSVEISGKQIDQLKNVELKQRFEELEHRNQNIIESIEYARKIQSAMLPSPDLISDVFSDHFILLKPRNIVSGDFYWFRRADNKIIVCVADCTGHGVPGALMSMLGISYLNEIICRDKVLKTNKILNKLNGRIKGALHRNDDIKDQVDGMDMALCIFNFENNMLHFSGAKNSFILIRDKELFEYKGDRISIGANSSEECFGSQEIEIKKGDIFYMFSDGYADQAGGPKGKKFMHKDFLDLLVETHHHEMQTQKEILNITIEKWKSHLNSMNETYEQTDDILIVGLKY